MWIFSSRERDHLAHLGYCGTAAGCGCCTGARVSHTRAVSSPNSANEHTGEDQGHVTSRGSKNIQPLFKLSLLDFRKKKQKQNEAFIHFLFTLHRVQGKR